MILRLLLLLTLLAPVAGAQNLYTQFGQTSVGLSGVAVAPLSGNVVNDDVALGLVVSGGIADEVDAALSVVRSPGASRDLTTVALSGTVYVVNRNGLRIGPSIGVQRVSDGRFSSTAASIGIVTAQQVPVGAGLVVPQATLSGTAVNGGGIQFSGGIGVAGVVPMGRVRLVVQPSLGVAFKGSVVVGSLRAGLVATL